MDDNRNWAALADVRRQHGYGRPILFATAINHHARHIGTLG